ncbi:MAG: hypothetical protein MUC59_11290, partial [Saprospiraceae bacterium]|nr:hypothetical protein [Saprospiraceae bacterium]
MNKLLIISFLCLMLFGLRNEAAAQCNPDIVPPVAVCADGLIYQASATGNQTALINAGDFDAGSSDNCTSQSQLSFFIEEGTGNSTPPTTTSLELGVGQYVVTLWVVDQAGNHSQCWSSLTVDPNCSATDVTPPVAACLSNYSLNLINGQATLQAISLNDGSYDNCPSPTQTIELAPASATPPTTTSLVFTASDFGQTEVVYWAVDAAGNGTPCLSTVTVDTCLSSGGMVCNDLVTVEVGYQETVSLYPEGVLEGGPYCYDQMVIGHALFGAPAPFMTFTYNDAGTYNVQVTHLPTGNSCWGTLIVTANCTGDVLPPTAVCQSQMSFQLSMNGPDLTILQAGMLDGGSFDDCTGFNDLVFEAQVGPILPTMTELVFTSVGTYTDIVLWVGDQEGNFSSCNTTVNIVAPSCSPDTLSPSFVYVPNDTTVD